MSAIHCQPTRRRLLGDDDRGIRGYRKRRCFARRGRVDGPRKKCLSGRLDRRRWVLGQHSNLTHETKLGNAQRQGLQTTVEHSPHLQPQPACSSRCCPATPSPRSRSAAASASRTPSAGPSSSPSSAWSESAEAPYPIRSQRTASTCHPIPRNRLECSGRQAT